MLNVYKPERWHDALFRPEVRSAFHGLVSQGWTEALRALHPDERIYALWHYFPNVWNAGLRLDHILLSPHLGRRLLAAEVDRHVRGWEKTSDHAPIWIEISDAPESGERRSSLRKQRPTGAGAPERIADHVRWLAVPTQNRRTLSPGDERRWLGA